eukprot:gene6219-7729_t
MPHLMILEGTYYAPQDETHFFGWLQGIPGITRVVGTPHGLRVTLRSLRLSESSLRALIALHWRYRLPMRDLAVFQNASNEKWFAATSTFWHKAVFGARALPASPRQRWSEWVTEGLDADSAIRRMTAVLDKPIEPPGPAQEFWQGFSANRGALVALIVFAVIAIASLFAPLIAPHDPIEQYRDFMLTPPIWAEGGNARFLLGTDELG